MIQTLKNCVFDLAPEAVKRYVFRRWQARRLTKVEFQALQRQFGQDTRARARYCHDRFVCRVIIDPNLILMLKPLQEQRTSWPVRCGWLRIISIGFLVGRPCWIGVRTGFPRSHATAISP